MRLHEYYFENLKGNGVLSEKTALYQELVQQFGSYEAWKSDFVATGMMRGIGWVILYRDPQTSRFLNVWINEHDVGHLSGGTPLLVMDVFEHAYITEYGLNKNKYIEAFFSNINWDVVKRRFAKNRPLA
jgi:Fe-Mn family superoxide dismutase